jgi:hypothetical protein
VNVSTSQLTEEDISHISTELKKRLLFVVIELLQLVDHIHIFSVMDRIGIHMQFLFIVSLHHEINLTLSFGIDEILRVSCRIKAVSFLREKFFLKLISSLQNLGLHERIEEVNSSIVHMSLSNRLVNA